MKKTVLTAALLLIFVLCIVTSPQIALEAAKDGFNVWWSYIFPVLLPMYLLILLCRALGLFHSISFLLIKCFNIPHLTTSQLTPFVYRWFIGSTFIEQISTQKKETEDLKHINKQQLTHLFTLSYNTNPILIIVIMFTAFIQLPLLGAYMVAVMVIATFLCAIVLKAISPMPNKKRLKTSLLQELEQGREEDGRSIGKLLGEGIYDSVQQLFFIGGVMLFGSVISGYLQAILPFQALFNFKFIIDQHIASYALLTSKLSFQTILLALTVLLSIGGCIQLFIVYGLLKQHQLSIKKFIGIRSLHATLALLLVYVSYPWLYHSFNLSTVLHTFNHQHALTWLPQSPFTLFCISILVTSTLLLTLLLISLVTKFVLYHYYKNKQA